MPINDIKNNKPAQICNIVKENFHLLILWSNAIAASEGIEKDLKDRFEIKHRITVKWSEEYFHENMSRFYGEKLPDIAQKILHCGKGEFLLYIILDSQPDWGLLNTTSGLQFVNKNLFSAKQRYREMTGGGHKVHATNNRAETLRDASLLLGSHFPDTPGSPTTLARDLSGAKSWESLEEFFGAMNHCAKYVVLRNYDSLPKHHDTSLHGDIDILCIDREEFVRLANARPVFPQHYRRYHMINIAGENIPFDIRDTDEGYYCKDWSRDIIQRRIIKNGIYIPCESDYLYSLTYHALIHKKKPSPDYCINLVKLFEMPDNLDPMAFEMGYVSAKLRAFMSINKYQFVRPSDWSVFCNYKRFPELPIPISKYLFAPPTSLKHIKREGIQALVACLQHKNLRLVRKIIRAMIPLMERVK